QTFPRELFKQLGDLGLMGMLVPEKYNGAGLGYKEYVAAIVALSKIDSSIGLSLAAHNSLCTNHILQFANDEQKAKWLPKLATGEWIGAWGLTEPNTGSDAGNMRTTAVLEGDEWVLNGAKNFITHGISGNVAVVVARTGEPNVSGNASAFVVERGTPGFSGGKKESKLGMRASETAEMIFDNCRIPKENILGNVGDGFRQALAILDGGRISISALSIGIAEGAYEAALNYAKEREQFGKPIASFQGISFKLADMATEIDAAKLLTDRASDLKDAGKKVSKESAMSKYYSSEVAVRVANDAVQILGGYGYVKDFPVEKFYRDAKLCTIGEGTSEIQKVVISRAILKG
ncbi:MAG TPA: acyl-CoA dehydrogenase, partial [Microscillaceae bacterium]|nr:acyl-CoA dehydrogenase [Microscillaceae bacterium]